MGVAAILLSDVEPFKHGVNTPSTEGHMWNLVKLVKWFQRIRRKKILWFYTYI